MSIKRHSSVFSRPRLVDIVPITGMLVLLIIGWSAAGSNQAAAQTTVSMSPSIFRIGEKLTYNISFGKFADAGYAETYVVSRGKIGGKDAVELRGKVKTLDLVSAAFFLFDESRTVYAATETGFPLYSVKNNHDSALQKEAISNYLTQPTANFDVLTLIFKAREMGGTGTFSLFENDQLYTASFLASGAERVKTDAGEFDTIVSTVQSEFLTANGIKDLRINLSTDEFRVPVLIRLKTSKGEFRALLSSISLPEPEVAPPSPTPTRVPTPLPVATPIPTPEAYVENRPLAPELGFELGESLEFRVATGGRPVGIVTLNARERKQFQKDDSLLLTATITGIEQGSNLLRLGDSAKVQVDPETLTPRWCETVFASAMSGLNQTVTFDKRTGAISFGGPQPVDAPIGTHTIISLIYAMRSFNLRPSKDPGNPVNDTRVAVFWESKAYVFTLRPSNPEEFISNGEKTSAQLITITTGNPELDALALKVWLSTEGRVPLRLSFGAFQADLLSQTSNLNK